MRSRSQLITIVALVCSVLTGALANSQKAPAQQSTQRKLDYIERNGRAQHPSQTPTVFSEQEINSYLASDQVALPVGVESVRLRGEAGTITGTAQINFDRIREGIHSSNPLLSMFSGIHEVIVATHAKAQGGEGQVHVDSVSIDGVEVPQFVLELFVEKFLTPKFPEIGIDSRFRLPNRIDSAVVGDHELTLIQK